MQPDVAEGTRAGVTGTPAFFLNERLVAGAQPLESFVRVLEDARARGGSVCRERPVPRRALRSTARGPGRRYAGVRSTSRNASSVGQVIACRSNACNVSRSSTRWRVAAISGGVSPKCAATASSTIARASCT